MIPSLRTPGPVSFFCLPLINSSNSPSSDLINVLTKAGLGKKKLVFSKDGNHQQFVEKINKVYPRLVQCVGFTLHRAATGGYGRLLISLDTQWFHVKLLRRKKVSGHGVIYIKSMQQNLSLDPITEKEVCMHMLYASFCEEFDCDFPEILQICQNTVEVNKFFKSLDKFFM